MEPRGQRELSGSIKARRIECLLQLAEDPSINYQVIHVLQTIENVPSTITDYRERERFLEDLLRVFRKPELEDPERSYVLAFRYLLGSLYVNFEKFWGPTIRVITVLVNESKKNQSKLLDILLEHLIETNDIIYSAESNLIIPAEPDKDRPDHVLHRNFIFQLMTNFAHYYQTNSEQFMNEYFRFIEREILVSPFVEKYSREDITKSTSSSNTKNDGSDSEEIDPDRDNDCKQIKGKPNKKKFSPPSKEVMAKRKSRETFLTATKVIQAFRDMRNVHLQEELKSLLMDLLCCRDESVQKASFTCLLAYDIQGLNPYITKVLKILNDKSARSELGMFSIDAEETSHVLDEHRSELMPILLRILFGKMKGQIGKKSSGRDKADLRKTLVMRFISGCTNEEISYFFGLLFDPIFKFVDVPYERLGKTLDTECEVHNYAPLNKLHAMLASLSAYMNCVAHLKEESLKIIFKIINIIVYIVIKPLEDAEISNKLSHQSMKSLKVLRRGCLSAMTEFFQMFEYHNFQAKEIQFSFKYMIWTSTKQFVDRNYDSPTPLMKFIDVLAKSSRYHQLLIKRNELDKEEYLLNHIVVLYCSDKTSRPVLKSVASTLASILNPNADLTGDTETNDVHEINEELEMIDDEDALIPSYDRDSLKLGQDLAFNHEILLGSIPSILDRLNRNCKQFLEKKNTSYQLETFELQVLSTLSQYLKNAEQSLLGARLLLSTLDQLKKPSLILSTMQAAQSLLRQIDYNTDRQIIPIVSDIISYQRNIDQRQELCNLLSLLAERDPNLQSAVEAIGLMNTSHGDMNVPDLVKWNQGFMLAFKYIDDLDETKINNQVVFRDSMMLLIHQIAFIMSNLDQYEFSIRENCLIFHEKLATKLKLINTTENGDMIQILINETLLDKLVRKGIRDSNTTIKHCYIGILRSLAVECHEQSSVLKDLHKFCDDNRDLDFWCNIRHIQLHHRSRALARLIANEELLSVSPKTLSAFFMPIAAGFLFSKAFKSVASLTENSIKLIGIICRKLNWITYESTLNYYLGLLTTASTTYQRQNIKVITEILKNFNFDITSCKEALEHEEENRALEIRMRKRRGATSADRDVIAISAPVGKRLNPSTAKMVYHSVSKKIIPKLHSCLHEMTRVELQADKNMSNYAPEKDEIKRIPIAFAIVQLLNLLPCRYYLFRAHLPDIFLKLSSFLKSKNEPTRKAARATLIRVMGYVGPAYVKDFLRELKQNLNKGFHIHVMNYTIHSVLDSLDLSYGDLDNSVHELIDSCYQEIFGKFSEDKEVAKILAKTFEAKKTKSYDTLMILASCISDDKLTELMGSLKGLLSTANDPKKVNKLSVCLQKVFTGLSKNDQFPLDKLLTFAQGQIEESIPSLKMRHKVECSERDTNGNDYTSLREDRFLIEKDFSRARLKSKINEKGNFHMIVDNCLRLLLLIFEKNKATIKRKATLKRQLDGLIEPLGTCLKSSSPKCIMRALKCLYFIANSKADLPSFVRKSNSIVKRIFILLSLYNGVGMVQGDNLEMIGMCFKTLTTLLLKCDHINLTDDQIRALLTYIEQDINDDGRQATAFRSLYSLIRRKIDTPELKEILNKVADLLVTSDDPTVQSFSIKIWHSYLLDYKLEKNALQNHLSRFLRQLDYELVDGRKAVLKVLYIVITKFPEKLIRYYFELMFHLLAQRIVNEESKEVRDSVARMIGTLIQRLPAEQPYLFKKFVIQWATSDIIQIKLLGIKLMSIFIESCKGLFISDSTRTRMALDVVAKSCNQKYESSQPRLLPHPATNAGDEDDEIQSDDDLKSIPQVMSPVIRLVKIEDKLQYHSLRLMKRLLKHELLDVCEDKNNDALKVIWQQVILTKLNHWHLPVVITASELALTLINRSKLGQYLQDPENFQDNIYISENGKKTVRTLCDRYLELLDRSEECPQLSSMITEALITLGTMIANSKSTLEFEVAYMNAFEGRKIFEFMLSLEDLPSTGFSNEHIPYQINEAKRRLNLMWLSVKVVMQARKEVALYRVSKCHRRDFVLKWLAAIAQQLGPKRIQPYAILFLMTPIRELTDKLGAKKNDTMDDKTRQDIIVMSESLLRFIRNLVGDEHFNAIYPKVQLYYTKKRVDRKRKEAILRFKDQSRGVKRKLKERRDKHAKRR